MKDNNGIISANNDATAIKTCDHAQPVRTHAAFRRRTRGSEQRCRNENASPIHGSDIAVELPEHEGTSIDRSSTVSSKALSTLDNNSITLETRNRPIHAERYDKVRSAENTAFGCNQKCDVKNTLVMYEEACQYCFRDHIGASLQRNGKLVVEASLHMSKPVNEGAATLGELSQSIINECKKLVKQSSVTLQELSTPNKNISTNTQHHARIKSEDIQNHKFTSISHSLCLSIHGLRALSPILVGNKDMKDSAILLLYHIVITSEAACQKCVGEINTQEGGKNVEEKSKNTIRKLQQTLIRLGVFCVTALETLTFLLSGYLARSQSTGECILLNYVKFNSVCLAAAQRPTFQTVLNLSESDVQRKIGRYTFDQLSGMVLASLIALTSAITVIFERTNCIVSDLQEFGKSYSTHGPYFYLSCGSGNDELQVGQHIFEYVSLSHLLPWIQAMRYCSSSCNPNQLAHRYSYKMFKALWKTSNYEFYGPEVRLSLQRTALSVLLLKDSTYAHDVAIPHFEKACTLAWKAVETYLAGTFSRALEETQIFHSVVGPLLDALAKEKINVSNGFELPSYIEYCSYRVRHVGLISQSEDDSSCHCVFSRWCRQYSHLCRDSELANPKQVTLLLHFVIETVKVRVLQDNVVIGHDTIELAKSVRQIIKLFQGSVLLEGHLEAAWHWKLLSNFKLHRFYHDLVPSLKASRREELLLLSEIYLKCMNPLLFKTFHIDVANERHGCQIIEGTVKSSIVALNLWLLNFDLIMTSFEDLCIEDMVNYMISCLDTGRNRATIVIECEMVSGLLAGMGRRLQERGRLNSALSLMVLSTRLCKLTFLRESSIKSTCSLKGSDRYSILKIVNIKLCRLKEALSAALLELECMAREVVNDLENSDPFERLLCGMNYMIRAITGYCNESRNIHLQKQKHGLVKSIIELISSIGSNSGISNFGVHIIDTLEAMFAFPVEPDCLQGKRTCILVERFFFGIEFVRQMGGVLQCDDSNDRISMQLYDDCCSVLGSHLRRICESQEPVFISLIIAIHRTLSAYFLLPKNYTFGTPIQMEVYRSQRIDGPFRKSILQHLEAARESLVTIQDSAAVCFTALSNCWRLAVRILQKEFAGTKNVIISYDELQELALSLQENAQGSLCSVSARFSIIVFHSITINCLVTGEYLTAAATSHLNNILCLERDGLKSKWTESAALSLLSSDTYLPQVQSRHFLLGQLDSLEDIEFSACSMRLQDFASLNFDEILGFGRDLEEAANKICLRHCIADRVVWIFNEWSKTTVTIGLAELYKKRNMLEDAAQTFRRCYSDCLALLHQMGSVEYSIRESEMIGDDYYRYRLLEYLCLERRKKCINRLAVIFRRLGDHRKAWQYGISLSKFSHDREERLAKNATLQNLLLSLNDAEAKTRDNYYMTLFLVQLLACATPTSALMKEFGKYSENFNCIKCFNCKAVVINPLSNSLDSTSISNSIFEIFDFWRHEHSFTDIALKYNLHAISLPQLPVHQRIHDSLYIISPKTYYRCATNIVWYRYMSLHIDKMVESEVVAESELRHILSLPHLSTFERARALYLLGLVSLGRLKRNKALNWSQYKTDYPALDCSTASKDSQNASNCFSEALSLLGSDCTTLSKNCKRNLALAHCRTKVTEFFGSSALLVSSSVGNYQGHRIIRSCATEGVQCKDSRESLVNIVRAIENPLSISESYRHELVADLSAIIPSGWKFISCAICPSGELLLSALWKHTEDSQLSQKSVCIFPDEGTGSIYNVMMQPLDSIIQHSKEQLAMMSSNTNAHDKESVRTWWNERNRLNLELETLLSKVEAKILNVDGARDILCDTSEKIQDDNETCALSCRNLNEIFSEIDLKCRISSDFGHRKMDENEASLSNGSFICSKMKDETTFVPTSQPSPMTLEQVTNEKFIDNECTFLILDENLQRFPFECFDCFNGKAVCRLPSLAFAIARLLDSASMSLSMNPHNTSFVLDPESNLGETRQRLLPMLQSLGTSFRDEWKGVIGEVPSRDFIESALKCQDGLLLYFGHGNASQFFSRKDLERLTTQESRETTLCHNEVKSSIVLMGCSSGRLESVNCRNTGNLGKEAMNYEPEGLAMSYLTAGSPCVIGNLWDVTDRDIDRLAVKLLENLDDPNDNRSIAQRLSEARLACKLKRLVGGAAVCYGFPVIPRFKF